VFGNIPEVEPAVVARLIKEKPGSYTIIDVRRPDEFNSELGHVPGSILLTLGSELTEYLERSDRDVEIIFVCRSGARSATSTKEAMSLGYKSVANMVGGMIRWNAEGLPKERRT